MTKPPHVYFVTLSSLRVDVGVPPPSEIEVAHVKHLGELHDYGVLVSCGMFETLDRGFQILRGTTKEEITEIVKKDPLVKSGYYQHFHIERLISPNRDER